MNGDCSQEERTDLLLLLKRSTAGNPFKEVTSFLCRQMSKTVVVGGQEVLCGCAVDCQERSSVPVGT